MQTYHIQVHSAEPDTVEVVVVVGVAAAAAVVVGVVVGS